MPSALVWVAALLLCTGGLCTVTMRRAWARWLGAALAAAGLIASGALEVLGSVGPPSPNYTISLVAPGARMPVTSPVAVRVCGTRGDGSAISAPDPSSLLRVVVDGREVLMTSSSRFAVVMSTGTHTLDVQVLDRGHRNYRPPIVTRIAVVVVGMGPLDGASLARCQRRARMLPLSPTA